MSFVQSVIGWVIVVSMLPLMFMGIAGILVVWDPEPDETLWERILIFAFSVAVLTLSVLGAVIALRTLL